MRELLRSQFVLPRTTAGFDAGNVTAVPAVMTLLPVKASSPVAWTDAVFRIDVAVGV